MVKGRLSILVLDDDPGRHAMFAQWGRGHKVDHVWYVDAAIDRLNETRYDIVCLDNDLLTELRREGIEVAAHIAAMGARIDKPVLLPRTVIIHSWNDARAQQMFDMLLPLYRSDETILKARYGSFRFIPPNMVALLDTGDLRGWIVHQTNERYNDAMRQWGLWPAAERN